MKVLLACEESQTVCIAFREHGHEAFSCDILPCSGGHPEWHIQDDVLNHLEGWDMIIAFPPCTHLASSGARHFPAKRADGRQQAAIDFFMRLVNAPCGRIAIENPVGIMSTHYRKPDQIIQPWMFGHDASKATCLWLKNLALLQPTRIIPPIGWMCVAYASVCTKCPDCREAFCLECGDHYFEYGCPGPMQEDLFEYVTVNGYDFAKHKGEHGKPVWANQTPSGQNKLGPSPDRARLRSKTYQGIAQAMAEQWRAQ